MPSAWPDVLVAERPGPGLPIEAVDPSIGEVDPLALTVHPDRYQRYVRAANGPLYVVFSGPPGPGVEVALRDHLRATGSPMDAAALGAVARAGACEFVELETSDGASTSGNVRWEDHPDGGGLVRLGPFYAAEGVRDAGH